MAKCGSKISWSAVITLHVLKINTSTAFTTLIHPLNNSRFLIDCRAELTVMCFEGTNQHGRAEEE